MHDLISRKEVIKGIKLSWLGKSDVIQAESAILRYIERMPSAERTGRWTHVYDEKEKLFFRNKWVCSACGKSNTYGMSDFCPCCGAMMENSTRRMKEAKDGE